MNQPSPRSGYSTREVASLLGLSQAEVRSCVRAGFVDPEPGTDGDLVFSFQDLVLLRTARSLLEARVPRRRIRIALQNLHTQLPQGRSLSGVRISAEGRDVVVRDGGDVWRPVSGQTLLDFDLAIPEPEMAALASPLPRPPAQDPPRTSSAPGSASPLPLPPAAAPAATSHGEPASRWPEPATVDADPTTLLADPAADHSDPATLPSESVTVRSEPVIPGTPRRPVLVSREPAARAPAAAFPGRALTGPWRRQADADKDLGRSRPTSEPPLAPAALDPAAVPPTEHAADWFEEAVFLEDEDPAAAIAAYRQALQFDPSLADAHLNLGRLLHEAGDAASAEHHYRQAQATRPDDPLAAYNLGVALQDQLRLHDAAEAYRQALHLEPNLADIHYNLSGVYEALGDHPAAFRHLRTYRTLLGPRTRP